MPDHQFWKQVRDLVRDQELGVATQIIETWLKGRLDDFQERKIQAWLDELLLHCQTFNHISLKVRQGLLSNEDERVAVSRLSMNLLALVRLIEVQDNKDPMQAPDLDIGRLPAEDHFEKILGAKSRLQLVSWLSRGLECSSAVCRLVSNKSRGTGFRIKNNLIITNNHVISTREQVHHFAAQFFFEEEIDGTIKAPMLVSLNEDRFWTSEDLDLTAVGAHFTEVDFGKAVSILKLGSQTEPAVGDPVTIIQHPLGGPKQIALTYNDIIGISDSRLQYATDTLPGSSGAPVFNSEWEVIAVHHAGGVRLKSGNGTRRFANEGITARAILSDSVFKSIIVG